MKKRFFIVMFLMGLFLAINLYGATVIGNLNIQDNIFFNADSLDSSIVWVMCRQGGNDSITEIDTLGHFRFIYPFVEDSIHTSDSLKARKIYVLTTSDYGAYIRAGRTPLFLVADSSNAYALKSLSTKGHLLMPADSSDTTIISCKEIFGGAPNADDSSSQNSTTIGLFTKVDTALGNPVVNISRSIRIQAKTTFGGDGIVPNFWLSFMQGKGIGETPNNVEIARLDSAGVLWLLSAIDTSKHSPTKSETDTIIGHAITKELFGACGNYYRGGTMDADNVQLATAGHTYFDATPKHYCQYGTIFALDSLKIVFYTVANNDTIDRIKLMKVNANVASTVYDYTTDIIGGGAADSVTITGSQAIGEYEYYLDILTKGAGGSKLLYYMMYQSQ